MNTRENYWPSGKYDEDLVLKIKSLRSLTSFLGKLGVGGDRFIFNPRRYYAHNGVTPRPPLSTFPQYGLGLKEAKDWVERYLASKSDTR